MRTIFLTIVALIVIESSACRASVNVKANAAAQGSEEETAPPANSPVQEPNPQAAGAQHTDYFGIARGLRMKEGARQASCSCVAAVVGSSDNPALVWRGTAPSVGDDALVIAISADGVPCDRAGPGPSVRGVERIGEDVVVVLEDADPAHPVVSGAIPNPGAGGGVYLRAHGKSPYGNPIGGASSVSHAKWCRVAVGAGRSSSTPQTDSVPNESESH